MITLEVDRESLNILFKNSKRFKRRFRKASNEAVYRGGFALYRAVKENMSRTDYSLEELEEKDHPYATRHGRIVSGRLGGAFTRKPYMIHKRSGQLLKDLNISFDKNKRESTIFFGNDNFYTERVIFGTKTSPLIPRDVISGTYSENKVKKEIQREMYKPLKSIVKSYGRK
jgi:hypothetical protein